MSVKDHCNSIYWPTLLYGRVQWRCILSAVAK